MGPLDNLPRWTAHPFLSKVGISFLHITRRCIKEDLHPTPVHHVDRAPQARRGYCCELVAAKQALQIVPILHDLDEADATIAQLIQFVFIVLVWIIRPAGSILAEVI